MKWEYNDSVFGLSRNVSFGLRDALRDAQIKDAMQYGSTKQLELKQTQATHFDENSKSLVTFKMNINAVLLDLMSRNT